MEPFTIRQEWPAPGLGSAIKEARLKYTKQTGKSLVSICKEIGINRSYWYQIEGEVLKTISMEHLQAIEQLFGVELYAIALDDKTITVEVNKND
jgi:transcriptional regulator with XRE-family HTH domain